MILNWNHQICTKHAAWILLAAIENGEFWLGIIGNLACPRDNLSQIWFEITKFAPNIHPGVLLAGMENGVFDLDLHGLLTILTQKEMSINVALVYWSRPSKGCYTSQCTLVWNLNPLRAKLLRVNINIYLHFMPFLHTNKTQVVQIPPRVRQGPAYCA